MTANTVSPTLSAKQNTEQNVAKNASARSVAIDQLNTLYYQQSEEEHTYARDDIMRQFAKDKSNLEDFVSQVEKYPHIPTSGQNTIVDWAKWRLHVIKSQINDAVFLEEIVSAGESLRQLLMDGRRENMIAHFADVAVEYGLPVHKNQGQKDEGWFTDLGALYTPFHAARHFLDEAGKKDMQDRVDGVYRAYLAKLMTKCGADGIDLQGKDVVQQGYSDNGRHWQELEVLDSIAHIAGKKQFYPDTQEAILRHMTETSYATVAISVPAAAAITTKQFPLIMSLGGCDVRFAYGERATAAQFWRSKRCIFIDGSVDLEASPHEPSCDCQLASHKRFDVSHMHCRGGIEDYVMNFDHHQNCVRGATSASCQQVLFALLSGMSSYFSGGLPTLVINDLDADTALSCALIALVASRGVSALTPRIAQLVQTVGAIDAHGPAVAAVLGGVPRFMQAVSFPPTATEQPIDQVAQKLQAAFDIIADDEKLAEAMKPNGFAPRTENESTCLVVTPQGKVVETKARNFTEAYQYGDFVVLGDVGSRITVGKIGGFSPIRKTARDFLDVLNVLERKKITKQGITETSAHLWGGSDTIGGAPRTKAGTLLSMDEIKTALINFFA